MSSLESRDGRRLWTELDAGRRKAGNVGTLRKTDRQSDKSGLPLKDSFSLGTLCLGSPPLPTCTAPHSSTTIPNR